MSFLPHSPTILLNLGLGSPFLCSNCSNINPLSRSSTPRINSYPEIILSFHCWKSASYSCPVSSTNCPAISDSRDPSKICRLRSDGYVTLKLGLLSRICGLIPARVGVPRCDIGLFPSLRRYGSHRIVWLPLESCRSEEHTSELQ